MQVSVRSLMHALLTICKQAQGLYSLGAGLGIFLVLDVAQEVRWKKSLGFASCAGGRLDLIRWVLLTRRLLSGGTSDRRAFDVGDGLCCLFGSGRGRVGMFYMFFC